MRGKALDYVPEYSKSAEENLSKAIKLLPSKYEAWDALGHVYWKKRDLPLAKKCFEGSLEQVISLGMTGLERLEQTGS